MHRHYFSDNNDLKSKRRGISFRFFNISYSFVSDLGVFSKNEIDDGTKLLLESFVETNSKITTLLDMGCGYGPIGIILSKYFNCFALLCDVNSRCIELARENIKQNKANAKVIYSNLYESVEGSFDAIVTNPPIRAGKKVIYPLFSQAKEKLNENGSLWIVIRKSHGANSCVAFLKEHYKTVEVKAKSKGFWVIEARV